MKKIVGIIAEYNPFHNGHLYHLKEALNKASAEGVISVMSGNFMQRGEPAAYSKWLRAEMAVRNGINLVIELPFIYACNSAEYFAKGGVGLLNNLGIVTHLAFGSERGSLDELQKIAKLLAYEDVEYKELFKDFLGSGLSYPKARELAVKELLGNETANLIKSSNNILAIEYLKQLMITNSSMSPIAITRLGGGYLERNINSKFSSAMAIRNLLKKGEKTEEFLPIETLEVLGINNHDASLKKIVTLEDFKDLLKYRLLTATEEELASIFSVGEGLENRILKVLRLPETEKNKSSWTEEFISKVVSKRYTETRIQRILIHALLGLSKELFDKMDRAEESYIRVLGADKIGNLQLKELKKYESLNNIIIERVSKSFSKLSDANKLMLNMDLKASDVYNLVTGGSVYEGSDLTKHKFLI